MNMASSIGKGHLISITSWSYIKGIFRKLEFSISSSKFWESFIDIPPFKLLKLDCPREILNYSEFGAFSSEKIEATSLGLVTGGLFCKSWID